MKIRSTSCLFAAMLAVFYFFVGQPTTGRAGGLPVEVLELQTSMKGAEQEYDGETPVIAKVTITPDILINLALGRPIANPVGDTEVLGFIVCWEGPPVIVVYDTESEEILATIAVGEAIYAADSQSKSVVLVVFDIQETGNENNGLSGGFLILTGGSTNGEDECPTSVLGTLVGVLQGVTTDEFSTEEFEVIINKGKLSVKAPPIGVVIGGPL